MDIQALLHISEQLPEKEAQALQKMCGAWSAAVLEMGLALAREVEDRKKLQADNEALRAGLDLANKTVGELTRNLEFVSKDVTTGLDLRGVFESKARTYLTSLSSDNKGQKFCALYLDLDYFKSINEKFDHATGDKALQAAVKQLDLVTTEFMQERSKNCVPQDDQLVYLGRQGGEELVAVFLGTEEEALYLAERIRVAIQENGICWSNGDTTEFSHSGSMGFSRKKWAWTDSQLNKTVTRAGITTSIGVACIPVEEAKATGEETLSKALALADRACKTAKLERNRIIITNEKGTAFKDIAGNSVKEPSPVSDAKPTLPARKVRGHKPKKPVPV